MGDDREQMVAPASLDLLSIRLGSHRAFRRRCSADDGVESRRIARNWRACFSRRRHSRFVRIRLHQADARCFMDVDDRGDPPHGGLMIGFVQGELDRQRVAAIDEERKPRTEPVRVPRRRLIDLPEAGRYV